MAKEVAMNGGEREIAIGKHKEHIERITAEIATLKEARAEADAAVRTCSKTLGIVKDALIALMVSK